MLRCKLCKLDLDLHLVDVIRPCDVPGLKRKHLTQARPSSRKEGLLMDLLGRKAPQPDNLHALAFASQASLSVLPSCLSLSLYLSLLWHW